MLCCSVTQKIKISSHNCTIEAVAEHVTIIKFNMLCGSNIKLTFTSIARLCLGLSDSTRLACIINYSSLGKWKSKFSTSSTPFSRQKSFSMDKLELCGWHLHGAARAVASSLTRIGNFWYTSRDSSLPRTKRYWRALRDARMFSSLGHAACSETRGKVKSGKFQWRKTFVARL